MIVAGVFWYVYAEGQRRWLDGMDLDGFNDAQLAAWKECDELSGRISRVYSKLQEFDYNRAAFDQARALLTPKECAFLEEQRRITRARKHSR